MVLSLEIQPSSEMQDSTGNEHELKEVPACAQDLLDAWTMVEAVHRVR